MVHYVAVPAVLVVGGIAGYILGAGQVVVKVQKELSAIEAEYVKVPAAEVLAVIRRIKGLFSKI